MRFVRSAGLGSLAGATVLLALARSANAQGPPAGSDKVAAEALFEDGRKLVASGKFAEACPKFAESERLDPSPSTLLNLANCWEKLGRSATAWATYREAESAAHAAKRQDYLATAQRHAEALAPKLARMTVNVPQPVAGIQVTRDGVLVGTAEWGTAIPVDSGAHIMEASAPGYKSWTTTVDVSPDGAQVTLGVPALEALPVEASPLPISPPPETSASPAPPATPPAPAETASNGGAQRTIGLVVAAAGVVGMGAAGVLAIVANNKNQDSLQFCPTNPNVCSPAGVAERNDARMAGDAATVALGVGAAVFVTGAVLWLTAPNSRVAARIAIVPTVGGAVLDGAW
jgi:hypothetical protein